LFGNRIGDIGYAIQKFVEAKGYTVVRELVGHGLEKIYMKPLKFPIMGKEVVVP
jgi:methionyl aminopeptidase